MKVRVKAAYFDDAGIHSKGEVLEVKTFDPLVHETVQETTSESRPKGRPAKNK